MTNLQICYLRRSSLQRKKRLRATDRLSQVNWQSILSDGSMYNKWDNLKQCCPMLSHNAPALPFLKYPFQNLGLTAEA